ncbi:MAG: bifunctional phosphoribosylaminoimidazolecarboxamide formyltransferase/IMP cyclohydrolase [bacterium]|nr:bifunctional phosphoribosylaminoimidazolecarboxamide formyltransferase/IMP cyclohydrolase [bacterium]
MSESIQKIHRALLSLSDKRGLVEFATALHNHGAELLSTGGTAQALRNAGIPVIEIADYTGAPEMFEGRVKTLHPKVHGGLLYRRDTHEHLEQAKQHAIPPIDLVCVNLYPFEQALAAGKTGEDLIEQIDIGGPAMLRSAAKNHSHVAVICDPDDYSLVVDELEQHNGTTLELRKKLAAKVFMRTSCYDALIARVLNPQPTEWQKWFAIPLDHPQHLRYGENAQQQGAYFQIAGENTFGLAGTRTIGGKEVSFNNWMDVDSSTRIVREFSEPACVIVKHASPCGVATGKTLLDAYRNAVACDPTSAFGGVVAFNRPLDAETATAIRERFTEVVFSLDPADETVGEILAKSKNLRWIVGSLPTTPPYFPYEFRRVLGGMLVEEIDPGTIPAKDWKLTTDKGCEGEDFALLEFAWHIVKGVKSNAVVFAKRTESGFATIGIGGGETSRVDAVQNALRRAKGFGHSLEGCALASDAFFPFADSIELAAEVGVKSIVEPGGSIKDNEVITAANKLGIVLYFTGRRHFRHL